MTDAERTRRFLKERAAQVKRYNEAFRETAGEATKILRTAGDMIRAELAGTVSEFQAWQLPNNPDGKGFTSVGHEREMRGGRRRGKALPL